MLAGPARRALAHVSSLWKDIASSTVLAGLADTRIQRLFTVTASKLRWAYTSVVRRLVLFHRVIAVLVIVLILELVVVVALVGGTASSRVSLESLSWSFDRGAMVTFTPNNIHSTPVAVTIAVATPVPASTSLLQPFTLPTVTEIFLKNWLARRTVLAG